MTGMLKRSRDISAFRRLIRIPGFPHDPEPKLASFTQSEMRKYCMKTCELYKFRNFINFFAANVSHTDAMTPMQREFIRLDQIFKSQMIAEMELKQRIVERSLIQDYAGDEGDQRDKAKSEHKKSLDALKNSDQTLSGEMIEIRYAIQETLLNEINDEIKEVENSEVEFAKTMQAKGILKLLDFLGPNNFRGRFPDDYRSKQSFSISPKSSKDGTFSVEVKAPLRSSATSNTSSHSDKEKPDKKPRSAAQIDLEEKEDGNRLRFPEDKNLRPFWTYTNAKTQNPELKLRVFDDIDGGLHNLGYQITPTNDAAWNRLIGDLIEIMKGKQGTFRMFRLKTENQLIVDYEKSFTASLALYKLNALKKFQTHPDAVAQTFKVLWNFQKVSRAVIKEVDLVRNEISKLTAVLASSNFDSDDPYAEYARISGQINKLRHLILSRLQSNVEGVDSSLHNELKKVFNGVDEHLKTLRGTVIKVAKAKAAERGSRVDLDHRKMLDYLIDEKEEKFIELVEGTRSHIANIDDYLKRMTIALEDDFKVQFYDPAFAGVRGEGRDEAVNLGQIERTTILTNNRTFAKVSPQATMEFDLPKRAPVIVEAMTAAKALMQDYGALMNDPTFVGLTGALSGAPAVGGASSGLGPAVKPLFPTLGTDAQMSFLSGGPPGTPGGREKTALEQLIPDPAVYKIQTGTGFEIRPVIQPDGHSLMYDFNYLYTTNIREPVDPDEKHLGRTKTTQYSYSSSNIQFRTARDQSLSSRSEGLTNKSGRAVPRESTYSPSLV